MTLQFFPKLQPILFSRSLITKLAKVYQPDSQTFQLGDRQDAYFLMGLRERSF
jgi:hypothetical protein